MLFKVSCLELIQCTNIFIFGKYQKIGALKIKARVVASTKSLKTQITKVEITGDSDEYTQMHLNTNQLITFNLR